jgi:hypothetical protein
VHGSLCVRSGVVYVGDHARTATVRAYDLDGRRLEPGFRFGGLDGAGGAAAAGIAVDDDRRVWIADTVGRRVRAFTLFGSELDGLAGAGGAHDRARCLGAVVDVAAEGVEEGEVLLVASGGRRRHAAQLWRADGTWLASLRPLGDPERRFADVSGVALKGRLAFVCETRARRLQVFRDGEFHYPLPVPPANGPAASEPRAVAPLADGRLVVALGGERSALLLLDAAGRLLRVLADHGTDGGQVFEPAGVALEESGGDDRHTLVFAIDRDGERVQAFTAEGTCYGAFEE